MPRATARAYRAAVSQVLKIDHGWEDLEVQGLDVDALISRFRNLSSLSPTSLSTYESRFRSALPHTSAILRTGLVPTPGTQEHLTLGSDTAKGQGDGRAGGWS